MTDEKPQTRTTEQTNDQPAASSGSMSRAEYMEKLARNPRFKIRQGTGKRFITGGFPGVPKRKDVKP
jgi:hypothetical protein